MGNIIEICYKKELRILKITHRDELFDTSRIENLPLEQWVFPFFAKGIQWKGLYEELKVFAGSESFILHFDGDPKSFEIVKHALAGTPVNLVNTNNIVTIVYSENPVTTKVIMNGCIWDTELIQNRYIDEWIHPIQVRGISWDGMFRELEKAFGTDNYTVYFVGDQKFMGLLMDNCPNQINIFYRSAQVSSPAPRTGKPAGVAWNTAGVEQNSRNSQDSRSSQNNRSSQNSRNSQDSQKARLSIKNPFIRNNILAICAVFSLVLLCLPFAVFSAESLIPDMMVESNGINVSGFETIFGIQQIKLGTNRSVFGFVLLAAPILLIAANYIKQLRPFQNRIAVAAPIINIIFTIATLLDIRNLCQTFIFEDGLRLKTTLGVGFFLVIIVSALTAAIGFMMYRGIIGLDKTDNG